MSKKNYPVKDCIINTIFTGALDPLGVQQKYCEKNCRFKCKLNQPYKKLMRGEQ